MSGKKGGSKKYWVDYFISLHYGFCAGPVDALTRVTMDEKDVFLGSLESNTAWPINFPTLFGGNEREGGVVGMMHVMLGGPDQLAPTALATRLGRTPENMTGFRGLATLFFTGLGDSLYGFNVGSNSPNIPQIAARFRRASRTLGIDNMTIVNSAGLYDSNPAHMLYELFCADTDWGMGGLPASLDRDSFVQAAQTLYDERFGLSMMWTKSTTIQAFAQEILDHIQGVFYFDPTRGKGVLKLIRGDYDPNALETLGPSDFKLKTFRRKLWGETVNEVVITYTVATTEDTDTVTYQDPGNIAMQGEVVSQASNYYGIRTADLAAFVGARDITTASQPLASATIVVDRRRWKMLPGQVYKFSYPKYDIDSMVMRVSEVDYGTVNNSAITVSLIEDIYALQEARFVQLPPPTQWEDPSQDPDTGNGGDMDPARFFMAAAYPQVVQAEGSIENPNSLYPEILTMPLVTPREGQDDITSYVLWEKGVDTTGAEAYFEAGEKTLTGHRDFAGSVGREATSVMIIDPSGIRGWHYPEVGGIGIIYNTPSEYPEGADRRPEFYAEFVHFLANLGGNSWLVARGLWDTVPRAWDSTANFWFLDGSWRSIDQSMADIDITMKVQPRTSKGLRNLDLCAPWIDNRPARPYFPFRPAACTLNGAMFTTYDQSQNYGPREWSVGIGWATRNRLMEDSIYQRWTDASMPQEDGQQTVIIFSDKRRLEMGGATSYAIDIGQTGRDAGFSVTYTSERTDDLGTLKSLQNLTEQAILYKKGYGSDWGYFYGGWPEDWSIGTLIEE